MLWQQSHFNLNSNKKWRKGWDSNPRTVARRWFSRPVLSAAQPPFQEIWLSESKCFPLISELHVDFTFSQPLLSSFQTCQWAEQPDVFWSLRINKKIYEPYAGLINQLNLPHSTDNSPKMHEARLICDEQGWKLCAPPYLSLGCLSTDLRKGRLGWRLREINPNTPVIKAVTGRWNVRKNKLRILDATGGLGRDAAAFAIAGFEVSVYERHPILALSLYLQCSDPLEFGLSITHADSMERMKTETLDVDVIYLDPMYPLRRKKALVKKEMQFLQSMLGFQSEGIDLLKAALNQGKAKRVVAKRPRTAEYLGGIEPSYSVQTPGTRYDVYLL